MFFVSCVSHAFVPVHYCLVVTCWEKADLLALDGDVNCIFVTFPCDILDQMWYLVVSFPGLSYFYFVLFNIEFYMFGHWLHYYRTNKKLKYCKTLIFGGYLYLALFAK